MRVVHLARRDRFGGAARAAARLHIGLRRLDVDSRMIVRERLGDDPSVRASAASEHPDAERARRERGAALAGEFDVYRASRPAWCERFSDDRSDIGGALAAQVPDADAVVLHWVSEFVDYAAALPILARRAPLVWVLHDLNPFTGGCHYDAGCGRWTIGCGSCPQLGSRREDDLSARIWARKRAIFDALPDDALHVVAQCRWMADCVRRGLLRRFPLSLIPPAVDTDVFAPRDRGRARAALGIAGDAFVVLFLATSIDNPRKGVRHVAEAFAGWSGDDGPLLLTVGRDEPGRRLSAAHRHLGRIEDDARLADAYAAADVTLVPSSQDNMPMAALESLACGTPVVGFAVGGLRDLVRDGETGMLVAAADARGLRGALDALRRDPARATRMRAACRRVALDEYRLAVQASRHRELYRTFAPWRQTVSLLSPPAMADLDAAIAAAVAELVRERFGAATELARIAPLAGDASTRRYARAWLRGPGAPASTVVMILADRGIAMSSDELAVFAEPLKELPYVNVHRFLERLGVAIPELYVDASARGLLLLEDIGDTPLWDALQGRPPAEQQALFEAAIDQLLLLEIDGTRQRDESCIAFQQVFDRRLYDWEFEHFLEYGLVDRRDGPLPAVELAELRQHFGRLSAMLDAQPRVLNHRDFHAWNLYVQGDRIRVIDFQDALLAAAPYDLATLLGDRDTRQVVDPQLEQRLLAYYAAAWARRGGTPAWTADGLWEVYATCALQKAFKVVGRFHYLDRVKGKPGYLRYLPGTWRQIQRLLAARPDLEPVRAILAQYAPELRR